MNCAKNHLLRMTDAAVVILGERPGTLSVDSERDYYRFCSRCDRSNTPRYLMQRARTLRVLYADELLAALGVAK